MEATSPGNITSTISSPTPPWLEAYLLPTLPSSVYYIPSFLPLPDCDALLTTIRSIPAHRWTKLANRRLLSLPSPLTGKARDTLLLSAPLPAYLTEGILPGLGELGIFKDSSHGAPNHVLVNEYLPAQGIMSHEDGPAYHPVTATVSLGSPTVLDIYAKSVRTDRDAERNHWRILQEPGSLLITMRGCYEGTLHGIAEVEVDEDLGEDTIANWGLLRDRERFRERRNIRGTRVSLTYRDVKKTVQMGGRARNGNRGK